MKKTALRSFTGRSMGLALASLCAGTAWAQFNPIAITPDSYTVDVVVEKNGPRPLIPGGATTASMDGGLANNGATWNEQGYFLEDASVGIPAAGATIDTNNHQFAFAPSYTAPNAIMLDAGHFTNANWRLANPAPYAALSFLTSGGNGGCQFRYTVQRQDGTTSTGTANSPDWFNVSQNIAWIANGRVNAQDFTLQNYNSQNPRLYSVDVTLSAAASPITNIVIEYVSGNATGHSAIMAISGAATTGGAFTPILGTGYNADIVVEATYPRRWNLEPQTPVTTATMDGGLNNTGNTWFEEGYYSRSNSFGLPAANSIVTAETAPDHTFRMPADYTANNALFLDPGNTYGVISLATPAAFSALSFLTAAGNGPGNMDLIVHHQDGSSEAQALVSPDWFGGADRVRTANGRVNVDAGVFDALNSGNPRLYFVDVPLQNTASPVTTIELMYTNSGGRAVIFGLSGAGGAVRPVLASQPQSVTTWAGSNVSFTITASGTAPITYQWQRGTNGAFENITGANLTTLTLNSVAASAAADYRVIASNAGGASTSSVAVLTILSPLARITAPGDSVTAYHPNGGSFPAGEAPSFAIDGTTSKYLNFGNGATPLTVPVGFVVTPAQGRTVVQGLRFYTANDAPDRDPANYILEGSHDGRNFTLISSNALSLPARRNNGGEPIDPLVHAMQQVLLDNTTGYGTYRVSFTRIKGNVNLMQIGEVEMLGVADTSGFPVVTTQPVPVTVYAGGNAQFSVTATGTPAPTYQWRRIVNGQPVSLANGDAVSGATTASLSLNNVNFDNAGTYEVLVSNAAGNVASLPVQLTVLSQGTDITSPGDVITSFGDESETFWGEATNAFNAIDDLVNKWQNGGSQPSAPAGFGPFEGPVGLVITPAAGPTVINALRIYTADTNPERDPANYRFEGSVDNGATWHVIGEGELALPTARGSDTTGIDPLLAPMREVRLANSAAFTSYRLTFDNTREASANSLQIAELELLGTTAPSASPALSIRRNADGTVTITSSRPGTLQSATTLSPTGTAWQTEGPISGSTTVTPAAGAQSKFYRVLAE